MRVSELWRYPVKSMAGERVQRTTVSKSGVAGDRAWALRQDGNTRNAKKFPGLMAMRARYDGEPTEGDTRPAIITTEDGREFSTTDPLASAIVSEIVGANVSIQSLAPADDLEFYRRHERRTREETREVFGLVEGEDFPDVSGFPERVYEFATPPGTFFDCYPILIMTTSSLRALQTFAPNSVIDVRRFRPNILIETDDEGFIENTWRNRALKIGSTTFRLEATCPRCVMTTIGFHDLPRDTGIMRSLVKAVKQQFGIYAEVEIEGTVAVDDEATLC